MARRASKRTWSIPRDQIARVATPVVRLLAGGLVIACLGAIAHRLANQAMRADAFYVDPGVMLAESLPDWLPKNVAVAIAKDVQDLDARSIFEPGMNDAMARALARSSPWIRRVERVEKVYPNRARIALEIERPVLAYEKGIDRYLIAADGKVLLRDAAASPTAFPFPILEVIGARPEHALDLGSITKDPGLRAAAEVAQQIEDLSLEDRELFWSIEPVALDLDVASGPDRKDVAKEEVYIRIRGNPVLIRFGRSPSSQFGPLDRPIEDKIDHLRQLLKNFPKLIGLDEVWLNNDVPYYRRLGFDRSFQTLESDP